RVSMAGVSVDEIEIASVQAGLLIFLGIENKDDEADVIWLADKIASLRIFSDQKGLMNLSVQDINGEMLVVSQFTLHAKTKKGTRPSFIRAARPETAIPLYEQFIQRLRVASGVNVATGEFGAMMKVSLENDGP